MKEYVVVEAASASALEDMINQHEAYELLSFTVVSLPLGGSSVTRVYTAVMRRRADPDDTVTALP
jgi:hypothetical protein